MAGTLTRGPFSSVAVQNRAMRSPSPVVTNPPAAGVNTAGVNTALAPPPAGSVAVAIQPAESPERLYTGFAQFTLLLLGFYVFEHTTFAGEILGNFLHIHFPVVAATGAMVTACALFSGRILQFMRTPVAFPWM